MNRRAKTGNTPGGVLRFDWAGRTSHRPASRRDARQNHRSADLADAPPDVTLYKGQWQQRHDLLDFIIKRNPNLRRLDLLHKVLQADAATLARIVEAIGELKPSRGGKDGRT
jgi:hypothetical protein